MTIEELAKKHGIAEMLQDGVESFARELVEQCAQIADGVATLAEMQDHPTIKYIASEIRALAGERGRK